MVLNRWPPSRLWAECSKHKTVIAAFFCPYVGCRPLTLHCRTEENDKQMQKTSKKMNKKRLKMQLFAAI